MTSMSQRLFTLADQVYRMGPVPKGFELAQVADNQHPAQGLLRAFNLSCW